MLSLLGLNINVLFYYRGAFAFLLSFFLMWFFGKYFIKLMQNLTQPIRDDGPETHFIKKNTPTLGGILMWLVFVISTSIFTNYNDFIIAILFSGTAFAILGFLDDFMKLRNKNSKGLKGKLRLLIGFLIGGVVCYMILPSYPLEFGNSVFFPFIKAFYIPLGIYIYIWIAFVITGTANAVNLTDGLDGLSSLVVQTVLFCFLILMISMNLPGIYLHFISSNPIVHENLMEVFVLICSLIGVLFGFLWYNSSPAKIFMGDTGSLFLGGTLGTIAIVLKHELVLVISGLILVCEAFSVIIQVYYYKMTKERIFLMAPLHHHYEKKGIPETMVTQRFWIFTIVTSVIALLLIQYVN